ncbi:hypothetical protein [Cohnella boryungensis]|uniref:DUF948 domain-containing protein n=1 Tax=Cohnella boryungensis TaxID=768479 RepID=A0ABV8SDR3_9BACL
MNENERLHYLYIIGILVWTGILVFAFFYGKDGNEIVSYIGFAGTLVSKVLAVNETNDRMLSQLNNTIDTVVSEIKSTTDRFNSGFLEVAATIKEQGQYNANIGVKLDKMHETLQMGSFRHEFVGEDIGTSTKAELRLFIKNLVKYSSMSFLNGTLMKII